MVRKQVLQKVQGQGKLKTLLKLVVGKKLYELHVWRIGMHLKKNKKTILLENKIGITQTLMLMSNSCVWLFGACLKKKQAGFAEPHSSSTIGWVGVWMGLGCVWVRKKIWVCKKIWVRKKNWVRRKICVRKKKLGSEQNLCPEKKLGPGKHLGPGKNGGPENYLVQNKIWLFQTSAMGWGGVDGYSPDNNATPSA